MTQRRHLLAAGLGASALPGTVLAQAPAAGSAVPVHRAHTIRTPDGLEIAAYETGNPQGPAILFIHGYAQAALSWERQMRDPALQREFRMVAYDLRGHGMSDKPVGHQHYRTNKLWADEVRAVIEQTGLARPTLVGWSYGGRVMGDYLSEYGHGGIGAMNWVAAVSSTSDPSRFGPGVGLLAGMTNADPATFIRATADFLRACFEVQPSAADFETMLAFNMMVPRHVRISLGSRQAAFEERLRGVEVPVLVTQGERDKVIAAAMGRHTASLVPGSRYSEYAGIGHAPFWEDAPRFNRELAELVRSARR